MSDPSLVETTSGRLQGAYSNSVRVFKGIPYAKPPLGQCRFMAPEPPEPWAGTRAALALGARSVQDENALGLAPDVLRLLAVSDPPPISEDCLTLNVWSPPGGGRRPVMVWLHGGAFIAGSGSAPWVDGSRLCRAGHVVVVTVNHRLGALGYLRLADLLGAEFADAEVAGMLDLVAALTWVRDNIAGFGGDPGNVTIFGESGGGAKVAVLMAMPGAKGLFHKAIIQSGPAVEMAGPEDGMRTTRQVLAELGLGAAAAARLRDVPARDILAAQSAVRRSISRLAFAERRKQGFNPVIGGRHFPAGPFAPAAPAVSAEVPLIIGSNKDEMTLFLGHAPWLATLDEAGLAARAREMIGAHGDAVLAGYHRARPKDAPANLLLAIAADQGIRMLSLVIAERKLAQRAAPVFVYLFAWETPVLGGRLRSTHALEIPFVFDNLAVAPLTGDGPERAPLAEAMSRAWIAFARGGTPDHAGLPHWPAYALERRPTMIFDRTCRVEDDPYRAERLAWNP